MAIFSSDAGKSSRLETALQMAESTGALILSNADISTAKDINFALDSLGQLHSIHLQGIADAEIPFDLIRERFPALRLLEIDRCELRSFPAEILDLKSLRELSISSNRIGYLPSSIDRLENLEVLMAAGCGLSTLPRQLQGMETLKALHLSNNSLNAAARNGNLLFPSSLEHLFLWANSLTGIPSSIRRLWKLKVLNLSARGTNGTHPAALLKTESKSPRPYEHPNIPSMMGQLVGVGSGSQRIKEIPAWLFSNCSRLQWVNFADNMLTSIPRNIRDLRDLRGAVFTANNLTEFPSELLELEHIEVIDLAANSIDSLPETTAPPVSLSTLCLAGNPLPIPPEIVDLHSSPKAIWDYFHDSTDARPLGEAKLLVVGEGSVGKTSLIKRLVSGQFNSDERKTDGIEITRWHAETASHSEVTINAWDFGGQEIMHATHQFFLTKRSVYLLVLDARQSEDQNRVEYWLKIIHGFSGGSPVIIVGNKCEDISLDIDRRGLQHKYPNIVAFCETSCSEVIGISDLAEAITGTVDKLPHVWDPLPESFFEMKDYLEQLPVDYLPYSEYEAICDRYGIATTQSRELLIGFLHDLGTVLCFRDDPRLRETNILSPTWVTGGVYQILNSNLAGQLKGLLEWHNVDTILSSDDYPSASRTFIVEMMKKFELCFESEGTFLVPDLLTKEEPDTGEWTDSLRFAVKYEVLPLSVMSRLIVRMNRLVSKGTVWRTGVVLRLDQNRALLKADREDSIITILVGGSQRGRRGLLTAIRAELRAIEATIPGLAGVEQVPIPGHDGLWVPYEHLLRLEEAGRTTVIPEGLTDELSISTLLSGVEDATDRALVSTNLAEKLPAVGTDSGSSGEAAPWNPANAMKLGGFLIAALVVVAAAYAVVGWLVGTGAAIAIAGAALLVIVVVALVVLRSGGRIGEQTMLDGIKNSVGKLGNSGSEEDEQQ